MHEYSLVRSLLRQIATIVQEQEGGVVRRVRLRVGTFAGVEPRLMEIAFRELVRESPFSAAELDIEEVPLVGRCEDCALDWELPPDNFLCPRCGGSRVRVMSGEAIELVELELGRE
ncbi:MAG: hydrogenase maturation nickel metallochaperone HypA [Planctomycetaceae bacterium]|nr:hydrogenase maturation nickel metallochaperone HypA [Planctomycetaceae bacterium]